MLRIAISADLRVDTAGGTGQVVLGLAHGLSRLRDGAEEYMFFGAPEALEWLRPHLAGACRTLALPPGRPSALGRGRTWLQRQPAFRYAWHQASPWLGASALPRIPWSDGTVERAGPSVVHFPFQTGFHTELPTIYQPHDLQHRHLPGFFTPRERVVRDHVARQMIARAACVPVASSWTRADFIEQLGIEPSKVEVVPLGCPTEAYEVPSETRSLATRSKLRLPTSFVFYPAQTWKHKNHDGLIRALAHLASRDLAIDAVFSGHKNENHAELERLATSLGVADRVHFVGFVDESELQCLYALARVVVVPSRFEAGSFPLWEGFRAGVPCACSNVTSLPRQVGDAALVFDPDDVAAMAEALRALWNDEGLRATLVSRGRARVSSFTWDRCARHFRAIYRRTARVSLSSDDQAILSAPPLL